jgi:hypothetical protein
MINKGCKCAFSRSPFTNDTNSANQNRLLGLEDTDVVAQPGLASAPTSPKLKPVLAISVLATGFALLLFVFIRQAVRNAGNNPESAAKLARIRQALGWRASKA